MASSHEAPDDDPRAANGKDGGGVKSNGKAGAVLAAALEYAAKGWMVFPARFKGKDKLSWKSKKFNDGLNWGMTTDPEEIRRDFTNPKFRNAGIGLPTVVSGFFVLEVDTPEGHDVDGIAALAALEAKHGPLPPTRRAISPTGSVHYYFKCPVDSAIKNSASEVAPGVDVRGKGGMVIAPPSVRPGKGEYKWLDEGEIVLPPPWLLDEVAAAASKDKPAGAQSAGAGEQPSDKQTDKQADPAKIARAMRVIPNDNLGWEKWNEWGMTLWAATGGAEAGFDIFDEWSRKSDKFKAENVRARWDHYPTSPPSKRGAGTIFFTASKIDPGWNEASAGVRLSDFHAYMPQHTYIYEPTGEPWIAASVNGRLPPVPLTNADGTPKLAKKRKAKGKDKNEEEEEDSEPRQVYAQASKWLDQNRPVEQMTWAPGEPKRIENRLMADGGWFNRQGAACLNLYNPPKIEHGDPALAQPWIDHVHNVYPEDAEHIIKWCAQRVQHPNVKINHALVLGGEPGIGKDTLLDPVKQAVGHWNFREIAPHNLLEPWTDYVKAVITRISEARDLGEVSQYQFYERMKTLAAAPPDVLRCNEKFLRPHYVLNCCGVIITTNYKTTGLYLPPNDRRHYVAWSEVTEKDFPDGYWDGLWGWYYTGGFGHVAAYLAQLDLSTFDPKAPPKKTAAFWDIVSANRAPEDGELADVIDNLKNPAAITLDDILSVTGTLDGGLGAWIQDRKNARRIPHRLEQCGYVRVHNESNESGLYIINKRRQAIYAKSDLSRSDQFKAAEERATKGEPRGWGGEAGDLGL
jgi:hypothetical protein